MLAGRDPTTAIFEGGQEVHPILTKVVFACEKRFWLILGEELTDEVLEAVDTKIMPKGWNDTLIMLIPKVNS